MSDWKNAKQKILSDPDVKAGYDNLLPAKIVAQIIRARKNKGMTQEQLASLIGVHQSDVARMEAGGVQPTAAKLMRIAHVLGMEWRLAERPEDESQPGAEPLSA